MTDDPVVGQLGEIVVRVRGGDAPGEVVATVRGTRETFIAYSDVALERGTKVLIITVRGPRSVDVVPWAD